MRQHFLEFWKKVGYSLPSSRFLARRMISLLDKRKLRHVIELGAGTGVLTREIIQALPPHVRIDLFEIEIDGVERLRRDFSHHNNIHIHHASAVDIRTLFSEGSIDAVVSTLPLGSLPFDTVGEILESIAYILSREGKFIQYQYWMVNRKDIKKYFTIQKTHIETRNFGPAFIYEAKKIVNPKNSSH